jgi:hypothetical protein
MSRDDEDERPRPRRARIVALVALIAVLATAFGVVGALGGRDRGDERAQTAAPSTTTSSTPDRGPTTLPARDEPARAHPSGHPTTTAPAPVTAPPSTAGERPRPAPTPAPPVTTAPPSTAAPTPPAAPTVWTMAPYHGLGTWLDTWDWSPTFTGGAAAFRLEDIDLMATRGVETLYIQTGRHDVAVDVLDPGLLHDIIDRAHAHDIAVVAWYLPTFQDSATDLRRLVAAGSLPVDGLAVDIESRLEPDHAVRTARLVALSEALAARYPGRVLGAITLPPVVTEIINPAFWPGHPWADLGRLYDVFLPMGYWGNRTPESGWRDGYRYTAENIALTRDLVGLPAAPVHPIGGVGTDITASEISGMVRASAEHGAIGGSIYDWQTTSAAQWGVLAGFRGW